MSPQPIVCTPPTPTLGDHDEQSGIGGAGVTTNNDHLTVGMLGCGTVGTGVARLLRDHADQIAARVGVPVEAAVLVGELAEDAGMLVGAPARLQGLQALARGAGVRQGAGASRRGPPGPTGTIRTRITGPRIRCRTACSER